MGKKRRKKGGREAKNALGGMASGNVDEIVKINKPKSRIHAADALLDLGGDVLEVQPEPGGVGNLLLKRRQPPAGTDTGTCAGVGGVRGRDVCEHGLEVRQKHVLDDAPHVALRAGGLQSETRTTPPDQQNGTSITEANVEMCWL